MNIASPRGGWPEGRQAMPVAISREADTPRRRFTVLKGALVYADIILIPGQTKTPLYRGKVRCSPASSFSCHCQDAWDRDFQYKVNVSLFETSKEPLVNNTPYVFWWISF